MRWISHGICVTWAAILLAACTDNSSRNVIGDGEPYFHKVVEYRSDEADRLVSSVGQFAKANGMDFVVSRDEPRLGDFNAWAAGRNLNFVAIHLANSNPNAVHILGITKGAPTDRDRTEAVQFACDVARLCGSTAPKSFD